MKSWRYEWLAMMSEKVKRQKMDASTLSDNVAALKRFFGLLDVGEGEFTDIGILTAVYKQGLMRKLMSLLILDAIAFIAIPF